MARSRHILGRVGSRSRQFQRTKGEVILVSFLLQQYTLSLTVACKRLLENIRIAFRYYPRSWSFFIQDLRLHLRYFLRGPYRIHREATRSYTYGETPLTTLDHIARTCGLNSSDTIFDLGCGPARTTLWLKTILGCQVRGVEVLDDFVKRAPNVSIEQADMRRVDYSEATAVYLYGTCFDESFLTSLTEAFKTLPGGAKVITVSYPLGDPHFPLETTFPAKFTWGWAEVYLQTYRPISPILE